MSAWVSVDRQGGNVRRTLPRNIRLVIIAAVL
jgi:hypothetical protein